MFWCRNCLTRLLYSSRTYTAWSLNTQTVQRYFRNLKTKQVKLHDTLVGWKIPPPLGDLQHKPIHHHKMKSFSDVRWTEDAALRQITDALPKKQRAVPRSCHNIGLDLPVFLSSEPQRCNSLGLGVLFVCFYCLSLLDADQNLCYLLLFGFGTFGFFIIF